MIEHHSVFRQELSRVLRFWSSLNVPETIGAEDANRTDVQKHFEPILQKVEVAFEDIPEDQHELVRMILMRPGEDRSLRSAVIDMLENLGGDAVGHAELVTEQLTRLHLLASLSFHAPYTYKVDDKLIRGSRPTSDKLQALQRGGCRTTINLCEEMKVGDAEALEAAELTSADMRSVHIPIVDNTAPSPASIEEFLHAVDTADGKVYVHCEAGVGRTGVMVACYRLRQRWSVIDARNEARNFSCSMPDQLATIEGYSSDQSFPSVVASEQQLRQTVNHNSDPAGLQRAVV